MECRAWGVECENLSILKGYSVGNDAYIVPKFCRQQLTVEITKIVVFVKL